MMMYSEHRIVPEVHLFSSSELSGYGSDVKGGEGQE